jgi:hypothetical protein
MMKKVFLYVQYLLSCLFSIMSNVFALQYMLASRWHSQHHIMSAAIVFVVIACMVFTGVLLDSGFRAELKKINDRRHEHEERMRMVN